MAMTTETGNRTGKLLSMINRVEEAVLCLLLLAMISLSCLQITLRSLFSGGLLWVDPLIQYLVLWSGLLGASLATARSKHIALDLVTYLVPPRFHPWILVLTHLFTTLTAAALVYAAYLFLSSEITYGSQGLFALPSWTWNLIFPLSFLLITIHAGIAFFRQITHITGSQPKVEE